MPYQGSDFPMADVGKIITYSFDFTFAIAFGETITNASWTCATAADSQVADASASSRISGPASITGNIVSQQFSGMLAGVKYLIEATAITNKGNTPSCFSHFYCDSPV